MVSHPSQLYRSQLYLIKTSQISEATAFRRLAAAQGRATRLENTVLKLEQRLSAVEEEQSDQGKRLRQRERRFRDTVNVRISHFLSHVSVNESEAFYRLRKYKISSIRI